MLVVGAGAIAQRIHLPYVVTDPRVGKVLVADRDRDAVDRSVEKFGVEAYDGDLASSGADLAIICTPPRSHAPLILEALAAGMHVVCEKPLVTSPRAAAEIEHISRRVDRQVFACYTNRFRDDVRRLRRAIREGMLGHVTEVTATWSRRSGVPGTTGGLESGVLWDLGAHLVDLALWCTGWSGRAVALATGTRPDPDAGSLAAGWYQGDDTVGHRPEMSYQAINALAQVGHGTIRIRASWHDVVAADLVTVRVEGSEGSAELRTVFGFSPARQTVTGPSLRVLDLRHGWRDLVPDQSREPTEYHRQLDEALCENPTDDLRAAVRSVALCDAFARSLDEGGAATVDVPEENP
ncbi:Gfo/Idh/MocA family protein [Actinoplanes sp. NPDC020271]|uniref:Gfo/Idh/MocA family protein n=1 Tax=Actinoplanes sp. NPDC020271 TaxID=3363896 RepID=UPI0037938EC2